MSINYPTGGIVASGAVVAGNMAVWTDNSGNLLSDGGAVPTVPSLPLSVSNGGTGAASAVSGFDNLSPLTTKGDTLGHNGTNNARLAVGADDLRLTALAAGTVGFNWQAGGGAGGQSMVFMASMIGSANGTIGFLQVFNETTGNPGSIMEQTNLNNPGINAAASNPLAIPTAGTITKAVLVKAGAAVSQGTTGGSMTARIDLYKDAYSSRALQHSLDFPVASAGVSSSLGGNNFEIIELTGLSLAVTAGLLGAQFTNRSANNNEITALRGIYFSCLIEF